MNTLWASCRSVRRLSRRLVSVQRVPRFSWQRLAWFLLIRRRRTLLSDTSLLRIRSIADRLNQKSAEQDEGLSQWLTDQDAVKRWRNANDLTLAARSPLRQASQRLPQSIGWAGTSGSEGP